MSRSPEEYFQDHDFSRPAAQELSATEKVFLEKYAGLREGDVLEKLGLDAPMQPKAVALEETLAQGVAAQKPAPDSAAAPVPEDENVTDLALARDFEGALRKLPELQLVSFFLGEQEFTIPIQAVQEVIRYVEPTKLPEAPPHLAGMINLRGKITACIKLAEIMNMASGDDEAHERNRFIVVCRRHGLQVGLMVEKVATMYRVSQDQIEWNIEQRMGGMVDVITALMRRGEDLLGIVSIDKVVEKVLKQ